MSKIDALRADVKKAQNEIYKIEIAERRSKSQKLIGKTFKYRNSYSFPEKPSDYFWLYLKAISVSDDGHLICQEFQTDKYGDVSVRLKSRQYNHLSGFISIPRTEYRRAFKSMQSKIERAAP